MINIKDYLYTLPDDRIAKFPLAERDQSKLLIYSNAQISHESFKNIPKYLPKDALMVFNNTRVIPARLYFQKETGATIELFLLNPTKPSALLLDAMQSKHACTWQCTIGNLKRWTDGTSLQKKLGNTILTANLVNRTNQVVEFSWTNELSFAEVVDQSGETPLPPYLKRSPVPSDKERYQTVYSQHEGAVAAPTAGLHFTNEILSSLHQKNIEQAFVTLHVSAGTFQPVKTENALEHPMHSEQIVVEKSLIEKVRKHTTALIPVGTTSMRTLESLYWMGVNVLAKKECPLLVSQHLPYETAVPHPTREESLQALVNYMEEKEEDVLIGHTAIYIHPGYSFKVCDALITNFHQPGSTLLLLIAAFVGDDWKKIYKEAMDKEYRFLSYGDSSLLWKK